MKKFLKYILVVVSLAIMAGGCATKEIAFDHENASFEVKDNMILVEAIAPLGILSEDVLFIAGPALGDSVSVVNNPKMRLEQSIDESRKWALYLDPADFKDGKTLADGFFFIALDKGHEVTPFGTDYTHTISDATIGSRQLVYMAGGWSNDFLTSDPIEIPTHDNFRVYVDDQTGWEEIRLYMWGEQNDLYGGWPGIAPAEEKIEIGGVLWTVFEIGPDALNLEEHLIVNNNNNGAQVDVDNVVNFDNADYFVSATSSGATLLKNLGVDRKPNLVELDDDETDDSYPNPGYNIYIDDQSGWPGALYMHLWNTSGYSTKWPGNAASGILEKDGTVYQVFGLSGDLSGSTISFIIHSDYKDSWNRMQSPELVLDNSYAFILTADGLTEIALPEEDPVRIFVKDERHWEGNGMYIHIWNDAGSTEWPGIQGEMATRLGENYIMFTIPAQWKDQTVSAIIHSDENDEANRVELTITLDKDRFYTLGNSAVIDESLVLNPSTIYVFDKMGWGDNLHLYAYGNAEIFGGWPGAAGTLLEGTFCGEKVYSFPISEKNSLLMENLIFNNGVGGEGGQFDGPYIETGEDHAYIIYEDMTWEETDFHARFYVEDNTSWSALYLYAYGYGEAFGGWPGKPFENTQEVGGKTYKYVDIPVEALGEELTFILHDNGDHRFEGNDCLLYVPVEHDFFFTITDTSISVTE